MLACGCRWCVKGVMRLRWQLDLSFLVWVTIQSLIPLKITDLFSLSPGVSFFVLSFFLTWAGTCFAFRGWRRNHRTNQQGDSSCIHKEEFWVVPFRMWLWNVSRMFWVKRKDWKSRFYVCKKCSWFFIHLLNFLLKLNDSTSPTFAFFIVSTLILMGSPLLLRLKS